MFDCHQAPRIQGTRLAVKGRGAAGGRTTHQAHAVPAHSPERDAKERTGGIAAMANDTVTDLIDQQTWLDPVADWLQKATEATYGATGDAGQQVKNLLSGTWLGHPLHPAVTDVPVGAWTVSLILDVLEAATGERTYGVGADVAQGIGLAGALGAALSGLNDWHYTVDRQRRVGIAHGLMNLTAAGIYGASSVLRATGARAWGRRLSYLAYGVAVFSAYVGGELTYGMRLGVDHAAEEAPEDFTPVVDEAQLADGQPRKVDASGVPVLLVKQAGKIYAMGEVCSHLGGPLSEGTIADGIVTCPWHGSQFALEDGAVVNGPATFAQPCFQTRVRNGKVEVGPRCVAEAAAAVTGTMPALAQDDQAVTGARS